MTWLHVAPMRSAQGADGYLVLPGKQWPLLEWQMKGFVKLPHLGGWWVPLEQERSLEHVLARSIYFTDLCALCMHERSPCDVAAAIGVNNSRLWQMATDWIQWFREDEWQQRQRPRNAPAQYVQRTSDLPRAARVLGLKWPATKEQIKRAFRRAALERHPDLGGSDAAMMEAVQARDALMTSPS